MHATLPLLIESDFPAINRSKLEILQVNLGYYCNQTCLHCHVNAGPKRTEMMTAETASQVIDFLRKSNVHTLDLTGGAPELHRQFKPLVEAGLEHGCRVIDRCNLTVFLSQGRNHLRHIYHKMVLTLWHLYRVIWKKMWTHSVVKGSMTKVFLGCIALMSSGMEGWVAVLILILYSIHKGLCFLHLRMDCNNNISNSLMRNWVFSLIIYWCLPIYPFKDLVVH